MKIEIREDAFNPWQEIQGYQNETKELRGKVGATAVFVGTMRDFNEGDQVQAMHLEHYPGMTEKHLEKIGATAIETWALLDVLVIHRVGAVSPNDPIVLVAAWSAHRQAAFEASRFIMEDLKSKAPFWKKEQTQKGRRWIENNTPG